MWTRLHGYMVSPSTEVPPPPLLAMIGRGRTLLDFICSIPLKIFKPWTPKAPSASSTKDLLWEHGPSWFLGIHKGSGLTWISPPYRTLKMSVVHEPVDLNCGLVSSKFCKEPNPLRPCDTLPVLQYCLFTELQQNKRKMTHTFQGRRLKSF